MTGLRILAWLPAAAWVYLVLFRGRFWLPNLRLPSSRRAGAMTVDSARRHYRGAGAAWKGRTYSRAEAR